MTQPKVAIIGAGASGLCTIKECLAAGLEVVCFEQDLGLGGLWRLHSGKKSSQSSVYESTVCNTSKEMTAFSDFPFPEEWPTYLPSDLIGKYLEMYAEHFGLIDYIKFNRTISSVAPQLDENGDHTGKWVLIVQNSNKRGGLKRKEDSFDLGTVADSLDHVKDSKERGRKMVFDLVIVATGHPNIPEFEDVELFQGKTMHSNSYKVPYPFKDAYVLIVGSGASGLDIASELASHAKQVYVSSRSGAWVLPKFGFFGLPTDQITSRALYSLPKPVINFAFESISKVYSGTSSLKPSHALLEGQPTINGEFAEKVGSGKIIVKPNISKFLDSETVQFEDDSEIKIDIVIYCTGYKVENHFLESNQVLGKEDGSPRLHLYKHIFPIKYKNIAWIGLVQSTTSIFPIAEMQARWVARVFSGQYILPSSKEMRDEHDKDWITHCENYIDRERLLLKVDYLSYMDMIASKIGCLPDLGRLWLNDWKLASQLSFGPILSCQYRLFGPGKWKGARENLLKNNFGTLGKWNF